jgi:ArsR family transcriptional regulator
MAPALSSPTASAAAAAAAAATARSAELFHALAEAARLEIIQILLDGEHCVCDLQSHLDIAQSRLSYHLKVLKDAGVVTDRRDGRWSYYTLNRAAIVEAERLLAALRPSSGQRLAARCC